MPNSIAPYWPLQDPFDSHIILADDTDLDGEGSVSNIDEELWLWPKHLSIVEAAVMFSDPDKTSNIIIRRNDDQTTYQGFTQLMDVKINWNGILSVCMRKPRPTEEGNQNGV